MNLPHALVAILVVTPIGALIAPGAIAQQPPVDPAATVAQEPAPVATSTAPTPADELAGTPTSPAPAPTPTPPPTPAPALGDSEPEAVKSHPQRATGTRLRDQERHRRPKRTAPNVGPQDITAQQRGGVEAPRDATGDAPTLAADSPASLSLPLTPRIPGMLLDGFRIPPFLLPIYQAAGMEYGIRWEILAAINEIETDYGRNLNVSSAGAQGWMQFMPPTWKAYGVDANRDGKRDPYNPVDAIFAAARYLRASGADKDLRGAIFAYNRADWYVDSVLSRARRLRALPDELTGALGALAGASLPVSGPARYAGLDRARRLRIRTSGRLRVVAVQDAVIVRRGVDPRLGRYLRLRDAHGNEYVYGGLTTVASRVARIKSTGSSQAPRHRAAKPGRNADGTVRIGRVSRQVIEAAGLANLERYFAVPYRIRQRDVVYKPLRRGQRVAAGTVLGALQGSRSRTTEITFGVRPASRKAPLVDPRPLLEGWRQIRRAGALSIREGRSSLGPRRDARQATVGQILLMDKQTLQRRVLANPRIEIYEGGRRDIAAGIIDRRVLASLEVLAANGMKPTVTSLRTGHGVYTKSGNVSHHTTGTAVDIAAINGVPILGHQGEGSVTDLAVRRLLTLQGTMKPSQIIPLMRYEGTDNTVAMSDHHDHIHIGWRPGSATADGARRSALQDSDWLRLFRRLDRLDTPAVRTGPAHP